MRERLVDDLARIWQVLLSVGLVIWAFMLFRVLRGRLRSEHPGNMPWLFFLAASAIPPSTRWG